MKILADENIPKVHDACSHIGELSTKSGRQISREDLDDTDILLVRSVTQVNEQLLQGTPVQFVASATAGFNHVDVDYLASQNIGFARAPGSNALSAAEYVIAAICYWSLKHSRPLEGLSLGIIGCGNVGSRVHALAKNLGIQCVLNDPPLEDLGGSGFSHIDAALDCDIVTLHVPLEKLGKHPTEELLNDSRIQQLKPDSLFINASRGEVVEEESLLERMQSRNDLDIVLDVWLNEPKISSALLKTTLLGTPHIAGYSFDGKIRGTEMIYQAICDYLKQPASWKPDLPVYSVPQTKEQDIRCRVLSAYDISLDDQRLKQILSENIGDKANYFDQLRKNYPVRREYSPLFWR